SFYLGGALMVALPLLTLAAMARGETGAFSFGDLAPLMFSGDPGTDAFIVKLRLLRALCAAGVGGSLALAGAMAQGLFRNPMAEPGLLGIGSGAALGAMIAMALLGGYGPDLVIDTGALPLGIVPALALAGAL